MQLPFPSEDDSFKSQNLIFDNKNNFIYIYENRTIVQIDYQRFLTASIEPLPLRRDLFGFLYGEYNYIISQSILWRVDEQGNRKFVEIFSDQPLFYSIIERDFLIIFFKDEIMIYNLINS